MRSDEAKNVVGGGGPNGAGKTTWAVRRLPPTLNIAPEPNVIIPPTTLRFALKVPRSSPPNMLRSPLSKRLPVGVAELMAPRRRREFPALRRRLGNIGFWVANVLLAAFVFGSPVAIRAQLQAVW